MKKKECVAMVRIQGQSCGHPQPIKSKSCVIADLKDKIAEVNYKKDMGIISEEAANLQISALSARIENIESGNDFSTKVTEETTPDDTFEPRTEEENTRLQEEHEMFMGQQALNNRAMHGL